MRQLTRHLALAALLVASTAPALAVEVPNPFAPGASKAPPPASVPKASSAPDAPAAKPNVDLRKPAALPAGIVFPKKVDKKHADESPGVARRKTCLDQYNANKAAGGAGNGGLSWIEKGGGYYSECNKSIGG
jgi:hypothetical protein